MRRIEFFPGCSFLNADSVCTYGPSSRNKGRKLEEKILSFELEIHLRLVLQPFLGKCGQLATAVPLPNQGLVGPI